MGETFPQASILARIIAIEEIIKLRIWSLGRERMVTMHPGARMVLLAGIASGQGKTTVTAALARLLARMGQRVRLFKCGPDFIDPMILGQACGADVHNLDLWMGGLEECRRRLAEAASEADVVLIEGVMGLYDGTPSAADLSREFDIPVVVVLDAAAMAQTAGAVVLGLRDYGPVRIAAVIANRVGSLSHRLMVERSLRDIPLLGTLPKQLRVLPERHLGLVMPDEVESIDTLLDELADQFMLDEKVWREIVVQLPPIPPTVTVPPLLMGRTVAVAMDAAFCFLYPANLEVLRSLGAQLRFFSPLANEAVPAETDALYLPGGYPELYGAQLSQAFQWQVSVRATYEAGIPIFAECGGMMALSETVTDQKGCVWRMASLIPGDVYMEPRLVGLGRQAMLTSSGELRGHTFHYSRLNTGLQPALHTTKHPSGAQGEAVYRIGSLTASYFHSFFPSNPAAVASLLLGTAW